jgi:hypothetical protein
MKDNKEIQKLIDLYWDGMTTPEEESFICTFYVSNKTLPSELEKWRNWFEGENTVNGMNLTDDFDEKILSRIEQTQEKKSHRRYINFSSVAAVAAAIVLAYFSWIKTDEYHMGAEDMSYAEIEEEYRIVKEMLIFTSSQMDRATSAIDENLGKIDVVTEYINIK